MSADMTADALRKEAMEAKACEIAGADRVEVIYPNKPGNSVIATFYYGKDEIEASFPTTHVGGQDALLLAAEDARAEAGKHAKPQPANATHTDAAPEEGKPTVPEAPKRSRSRKAED